MQKSDESKYAREAQEANFKIIGSGREQRTKGSRMYECLTCAHQQEFRLADVRKKNARCKGCFDTRLEQDAQSAGVRIVGLGQNANYRMCEFLDCKCQQSIQVIRIRNKQFKCQQCEALRFREDAEKKDLIIKGDGDGMGYRRYQFKACGHEANLSLHHVRNDNVTCNTCKEIQHENEATARGIQLIGKCNRKNYRKYKLGCGHELELQIAHVRRGGFECKFCNQGKFEHESAAVGLLYLGRATGNRHRYRHLKCGNEQVFEHGNVRAKTFACRVCNPNAGGYQRTLPATFYVHKIESSAICSTGYGISNNEPVRKKRHILRLSRQGFRITESRVWHHTDGELILMLENSVSCHFPMDQGMAELEGFKRESTKAPFLEVCAFVDSWMKNPNL
ncbi:hypothetical protein [Chitinibacter sp. S2-10]|uniref:hypothetical protein n=1 Tax=Chitinibacter sp. S2-10 TaxID=3373597 RepID=UPI00397739A7